MKIKNRVSKKETTINKAYFFPKSKHTATKNSELKIKN